MPSFAAGDGLRLAYRVLGTGPELLCVPGGPMRDSAYYGDLGGLSQSSTLILFDLRGTGQSGTPADLATCRCDRLVDDVEALRVELGLGRVDLLGNSAGANIVVRYAERYPERVSRLVLITPSTRAVGLAVTYEQRLEIAHQRKGEPWYTDMIAALERVNTGQGRENDWDLIAPMLYGRWDTAAQAFEAEGEHQQNEAAAEAFGAEGAFEPELTRAALSQLTSPVLLLAGELDPNTPPAVAADFAALFPNCELVIQPGAGHFPWLDDPAWFRAATSNFLAMR